MMKLSLKERGGGSGGEDEMTIRKDKLILHLSRLGLFLNLDKEKLAKGPKMEMLTLVYHPQINNNLRNNHIIKFTLLILLFRKKLCFLERSGSIVKENMWLTELWRPVAYQ